MRPPPKLDEVRRYYDPEPPAEGYNPEGYKTWVGTFVCDKKAQWFYYVQAHAEGVVVDARDGCDFRCIGCDLSGDVIVKAEGNASVDLNSCNLHATTTVVQAKDTSDVMLTAVGFDAKAGHPAVSVSDEAEFSLYRSELRAVRPIEAKGAAKLIFDEVTLIGSDGALWATPGVKIKEFSDVHYVGEKLTTWEPEPEPEPSEHEESF
jgi:hypothetical protein